MNEILIFRFRALMTASFKGYARAKSEKDEKHAQWCLGKAQGFRAALEILLDLGVPIPRDNQLEVAAELAMSNCADFTNHELSRTLHWYKNNTNLDPKSSLCSEETLRKWLGQAQFETEKKQINDYANKH